MQAAVLSFGSETGRARSGTKGFSNRSKKLKKKKQEFHTHRRLHIQESELVEPEQVRARTVLALDRLGHQLLSTEPGGYDLDDWKRSLDSLLDDFQEKVGPGAITDEFRNERKEVFLSLPQSADPGDLDAGIEKLKGEEAASRTELAEMERKATAKLVSLTEERDACERDLKSARERLVSLQQARQSRQFFSRLIGGGPSTEGAEASVASLEAKLAPLNDEVNRHRKARSGAVGDALPSSEADSKERLRRKLDDIEKQVLDLQTARQTRLQLSQEREAATKRMSGVISSMKLPSTQGEGDQSQR